MRIASSLAAASLLFVLAACSASQAPAQAGPAPTGPVVTTIDSLPATVEGTLVFDLDGGAEGDGVETYGSFQLGEDHLSVKMPTTLARSLEIPEDGARVRMTIGSEQVEDGDSTLVITAAQRL